MSLRSRRFRPATGRSEVSAPGIKAPRPAIASRIGSPHDVVGAVDDAVSVVVARQWARSCT